MAKKQVLCTKCQRAAAPGHRQCKHHLNYFRQYRKARREAGLCIHCGVDAQGYQLCDACGARSSSLMRARYYARREAGQCVACGKPSQGFSLCKTCTARKARRRRALRPARPATSAAAARAKPAKSAKPVKKATTRQLRA